ncbi:MAG: shikimate dehydrogenase [Verrucomicrobiota bacterium]|jgi:shikimate dehydrogenase
MHNSALKELGIPCSYVRLHIRPNELQEAIRILPEKGFWGVNLTIPHKASVIPFLDSVDPQAAQLGVVNTVAFREGRRIGFNTDGPGLARAILSDFDAALSQLRVLVVGAGGGAGRAIAIQCALEGSPHIFLSNRTESKALALKQELERISQKSHPHRHSTVETVSSDLHSLQRALQQTDLILQCSSLGMTDGDPSPLPKPLLSGRHLVYDTIYSRKTQLLLDAAAQGARRSDGFSMLLHQGALAFEIWFGLKAPIATMERALASVLRISHPSS